MIDEAVASGTPSESIVVGGFSQGGAMALGSVIELGSGAAPLFVNYGSTVTLTPLFVNSGSTATLT